MRRRNGGREGGKEEGREGGNTSTYLEWQRAEMALIEEGLDEAPHQGLFCVTVLLTRERGREGGR